MSLVSLLDKSLTLLFFVPYRSNPNIYFKYCFAEESSGDIGDKNCCSRPICVISKVTNVRVGSLI